MAEYDIGWGKPPKKSRFKEGASGNPKGRPKGSLNFLTILDQELKQKIVVNENGKKKTVTRMQAMVKRVVAAGLQGDPKHVLLVVEMLKRMGRAEAPDLESLVPDDYGAILDAYATQLHQSKVA